MRSCIFYEDLFQVPYCDNGRDLANGLDCYGLVLECCERNGTPLDDVVYPNIRQTPEDLERYKVHLNVKEIEAPEVGCVIQALFAGLLHIGFLINKNEVLHMTFDGVRINRVEQFVKPKFFKVVESGK